MIILIAIATFFSTLLGGLFALKFRDKLHLILGFSAGAVIAVAFFDLLPEALELGSPYFDGETLFMFVAIGFFAYLILDRWVFLHTHPHEDDHDHQGSDSHTAHKHRGILGAGSLSIHSFLDGVAIGLAFQVSVAVGAIVTVAVLAHDFSDGINTVNMILKNKGEGNSAFRWLIVDAVAPVLGVISTLFFTVPESGLAVILAIFSGFFLYIGASDLVPESHHAHPKLLTTAMTIVGAVVLFTAVKLAGV